jgi:ribosome-associated toxin RatA of RatAB toxin-antitoxin module
MIEPLMRTLHCSCEQAFDIAADIERYPEFLRGWMSAKITKRDLNVCYVEQEVGFGPVHCDSHRPPSSSVPRVST